MPGFSSRFPIPMAGFSTMHELFLAIFPIPTLSKKFRDENYAAGAYDV
jgi:hypothetical protein